MGQVRRIVAIIDPVFPAAVGCFSLNRFGFVWRSSDQYGLASGRLNLVNFVGSFFVPGYDIFPGFVFGVIIGSSIFYSGYKIRRILEV